MRILHSSLSIANSLLILQLAYYICVIIYIHKNKLLIDKKATLKNFIYVWSYIGIILIIINSILYNFLSKAGLLYPLLISIIALAYNACVITYIHAYENPHENPHENPPENPKLTTFIYGMAWFIIILFAITLLPFTIYSIINFKNK